MSNHCEASELAWREQEAWKAEDWETLTRLEAERARVSKECGCEFCMEQRPDDEEVAG